MRNPAPPSLVDPDALSSVAAFHRLFQCPILARPVLPPADRCRLRVSLLEEEVGELADAIDADDLIEVADALADIQYVLSGAVLEFGMGGIFKSLFDEVQRSNMSKACTTLEEAERTRAHYLETKATESYVDEVDGQWLVYREGDRKALKSVEYSPAALASIIEGAIPSSASPVDPVCLKSVAAFHRLFQCPVVADPAIPAPDRCRLRVSLLKEEVRELREAIDADDLIEVADALADIQYVLSGAVLEFGMGSVFKALFDEVQRSNMSKACSTLEEAERTRAHYLETKGTESLIENVDGQWLVYREEDRKVLKSIRYSPANLSGILRNALPPSSPPSSKSASSTSASPTSVQLNPAFPEA